MTETFSCSKNVINSGPDLSLLLPFLNTESLDLVAKQTAKTLMRAVKAKEPLDAAQKLVQLTELDISRDPWSSGGAPMSLDFLNALTRIAPDRIVSFKANYQKFTEDLSSQIRNLSLKVLSLRDVGSVNLSKMGNLDELEDLDLSACTIACEDFDLIGGFVNLKKLSLAKVRLKDCAFVASLQKLETLDLSENDLSKLPDLSALQALRTLNISKNLFDGFDAVSALKMLRVFDCSDNAISALDALSDLRNLCVLKFSRNRVRSIKPLAHLDLLESVSLSFNPVHEEEIDQILRRRVKLD